MAPASPSKTQVIVRIGVVDLADGRQKLASEPDCWMIMGAEAVGVGLVDAKTAEDVESVHGDRDRRLDDALRRLGVLPDVELCDSCHCRRCGAAHEDDLFESRRHLRIHVEQQCDVRLGGQRDQGHPLSGLHDQLMQQLDRMQR